MLHAGVSFHRSKLPDPRNDVPSADTYTYTKRNAKRVLHWTKTSPVFGWFEALVGHSEGSSADREIDD